MVVQLQQIFLILSNHPVSGHKVANAPLLARGAPVRQVCSKYRQRILVCGARDISTTYIVAALLIAPLYLACRWYRTFKATYRDSVLKYFNITSADDAGDIQRRLFRVSSPPRTRRGRHRRRRRESGRSCRRRIDRTSSKRLSLSLTGSFISAKHNSICDAFKRVVQSGEHVGRSHVHAGHRFGGYDDLPDRRGRRCDSLQHLLLKQFGVREE